VRCGAHYKLKPADPDLSLLKRSLFLLSCRENSREEPPVSKFFSFPNGKGRSSLYAEFKKSPACSHQ